MTKKSTDIRSGISKAMLQHPDTIVVVDEEGRMRLSYAEELQPASNG